MGLLCELFKGGPVFTKHTLSDDVDFLILANPKVILRLEGVE